MKAFLYCILTFMLLASITACGNSSSGNTKAPRNALGIPQLTESRSHKGWETKECVLCHTSKQINAIHEFNPNLAKSFEKAGYNNVGACLYCHGTNGIKNLTADSYQCMLCHSNPSIVASASLFTGSVTMHKVTGGTKMTNADCITCHKQSDMDGKINLDKDFTQTGMAYTSTNDFCLNCHSGSGAFGITPPALKFATNANNIYDTFMGYAGQVITSDVHGAKVGTPQAYGVFRGTYTYNMVLDCTACHDVHTSDNSYLITGSGDSAEKADDVAKNAPVSVSGNDFTQLCAVCHTSVGGSPAGNGLTTVYHPSGYDANCTNCHYHGAGYGSNNHF